MSPIRAVRAGRAIARVLSGSWRAPPPPSSGPTTISTDCVERLLRSGCGALAWRRLRGTRAGKNGALTLLHEAARTYALRAAVEARQIAELVRAMRETGVDPLLLKGWSAARLYGEPSPRPFGDVDVFVRATQRDRAVAAVRASTGDDSPPVDFHGALHDLSDRPVEEVLARSRLVSLHGVEIRVLSPEDHLRCIALHFFRHGGARPLSLCDVAAALEATAPDFDWEYCLRGDPLLTDRLIRTMALASTMLGARLPASAPVTNVETLPRWLTRAVLRQWGARSYDRYVNRPLIECLGRRGERVPALRRRWPGAIQLIVDRNEAIEVYPPIRLQLESVFSMTLGFAHRTWRSFRAARVQTQLASHGRSATL